MSCLSRPRDSSRRGPRELDVYSLARLDKARCEFHISKAIKRDPDPEFFPNGHDYVVGTEDELAQESKAKSQTGR